MCLATSTCAVPRCLFMLRFAANHKQDAARSRASFAGGSRHDMP